MSLKLITPEGGDPAYHLVLALRDEIIGSVTFKNKSDKDAFCEIYRKLHALKFGMIGLEIDTKEENENAI